MEDNISSYYSKYYGKSNFWSVPVRIERLTDAPLDCSTLFKTYAEALTYANGGVVSCEALDGDKKKIYTQSNAYPGQYIAVVPEDGSDVSAFIIGGKGILIPLATGSDLETTLTQLQSDLSTLSANTLSDIADEVSARIADVTALSDAISSEVSTRVADVSVLSDAITALETKSNNLSDAISVNIDDIAKLSDEFKDFSEISLSGVDAVKEQLAVTVEELESAESGYLKTYIVKQNGTQVGASINIPKDFLVKSATVKTCETAGTPVADYVVGDKYLDFVLNTADTEAGTEEAKHVYIKLTDLVDVYTGGETDTITVNVSDSGVITATLKNSSVTTDHLKDGTVTNAKLGLSAVATNNIQDSAITEVKLSDGAVSEGKIKEDAVTTGKIKDQAVTSAKLATDSVTNVKIVDKAVTTAKLDDGAVTTDKIANKAVTRDKLSDELTGAIDSFATKAELETEKSRAEAAEKVNADAIAAETTRATGVESGLRTDLDTEIARAKGIEEGLRTDLNNEISRSEAKDGELTQAIADEASAARAAEQALGERIDNLTLSEITVPANQTIDKISQVNGQVSVTTKDIEISASQVTGLDDALTSFVKLTDFNTVSSDLDSRLTAVSGDLDKLEANVETLSGTVDSNKTALEGSIKTVSDNLNTVSSNLDTLEGAVTDLIKTVGDNKSELTGSIKAVSDNLSTVSSDLDKLEATVESNKSELTGSIKTVSDNLDELSGTVGELQTNLEGEIAKKLDTDTFAELSVKVGLDAASETNKVATQSDITAAVADLVGAMHFRDAVETYEQLTSITDPKPGDVVIVTSTTKEYVYNSTSAWVELGDEGNHATKTELSTEISARISADNVLEGKINEISTSYATNASVSGIKTELEGKITTEAEARAAADTALSTAIDNKVFIDGVSADSLSVVNISQDDYHALVKGEGINPNTVYIVSSDTYNMYDQKIINLAPGTEEKDAVNFGQLSSLSGQIMTEVETNKLSSITIGDNVFTPENNNITLTLNVISCGGANLPDELDVEL